MIPQRCPASTTAPTGPAPHPCSPSNGVPLQGWRSCLSRRRREAADEGGDGEFDSLGRWVRPRVVPSGWCPAGLECPAFGGDHQGLGRAGLGLAVLVYVGGHRGQALLELAPGIAASPGTEVDPTW